VGNFELRLKVSTASRVDRSQPISNVVFVKSPLFNGALQTLAVIEKVFNKKSLKVLLSY